MDTNDPQVEQSGCGCDSSPNDEICCGPGGKKSWRTVLFIAVLVLAGAVAAHSVLTNGGNGASPCGGAGGFCSIEQGNGGGCPLTAALQKDGNGNGGSAALALEEGNGDGAACPFEAACALEEGNGDGAVCPKTGTQDKPAGCCPGSIQPVPSPEAPARGCCPGSIQPVPSPEAPTRGCCPGSRS